MTAQLELTLAPSKAPKVSPAEIELTLATLRAAGDWRTSEQLGFKTWADKRKLRAIAEASDGKIVSWPGSPGYKLFDYCTPEEFARADRGLAGEERGIKRKRAAISRRMHERNVVFPTDYQPDTLA